MFTGLVEHLGRVEQCDPSPAGRRIVIDCGDWAHGAAAGDSIAVNGCCLTVVSLEGPRLAFDVIQRSLDVTTLGTLEAGAAVNLEASVTPATRLGGHIVQGHVDGVGRVVRVQADPADWRVRIAVPEACQPAIVPTGSVTVNGVSLTIAGVFDDGFEIALIPTTLERTNLDALAEGDGVNIEVDAMAKVVLNWLERCGPALLQGGQPPVDPSAA